MANLRNHYHKKNTFIEKNNKKTLASRNARVDLILYYDVKSKWF